MKISDLEAQDITALKVKKDSSGEARKLDTEIKSWFHHFLKEQEMKVYKTLKGDKLRIYARMKEVSNFTAELYNLPKFDAKFLRKRLPSELLHRIYLIYGKHDTILMSVVFMSLNEIVNLNYLLGGEVWSYKLLKDGYVNDEMKRLEDRGIPDEIETNN